LPSQLSVKKAIWPEFGNVAWKAVRLGRWTGAEAQPAIRDIAGRSFPTVSAKNLLVAVFGPVKEFNCSVYDSIDVAPAVTPRSEMFTADEKLANALSTHLPVRWPGAL
jgi:predicted nucleic acid-binding protein